MSAFAIDSPKPTPIHPPLFSRITTLNSILSLSNNFQPGESKTIKIEKLQTRRSKMEKPSTPTERNVRCESDEVRGRAWHHPNPSRLHLSPPLQVSAAMERVAERGPGRSGRCVRYCRQDLEGRDHAIVQVAVHVAVEKPAARVVAQHVESKHSERQQLQDVDALLPVDLFSRGDINN
jgi:hypothetical protein